MVLDRAPTDTKKESNLLAGLSCDHQIQHPTLTGREGGDARCCRIAQVSKLGRAARLFQRAVDGGKQLIATGRGTPYGLAEVPVIMIVGN